MRTMIVVALMGIVIAIYASQQETLPKLDDKADAYAANYFAYRKAVLSFATSNPAPAVDTAATFAQLQPLLPTGMVDFGFMNRITPLREVYVYGSVARDPRLDVSIPSREWGLSGLGIARNGRVVSPALGDLGLTIPFIVADGTIVSYARIMP